jgi:chemotaxis-related protein WspB
MLFLLFAVGQNRYAIDVRQISEVLPLISITQVPCLSDAVVGVFNRHGRPLPIIDLSLLIFQRPTSPRLSTRVIVAHHSDESDHSGVGLIAEHVMTTFHGDPTHFVDSGLRSTAALSTGPMMTDKDGVIQWIDVKDVLPPSIERTSLKAIGGSR